MVKNTTKYLKYERLKNGRFIWFRQRKKIIESNSTLLALLLYIPLNIFIALSVPKFHL